MQIGSPNAEKINYVMHSNEVSNTLKLTWAELLIQQEEEKKKKITLLHPLLPDHFQLAFRSSAAVLNVHSSPIVQTKLIPSELICWFCGGNMACAKKNKKNRESLL